MPSVPAGHRDSQRVPWGHFLSSLEIALMAEVKVKVQPPDADPVEIENRYCTEVRFRTLGRRSAA